MEYDVSDNSYNRRAINQPGMMVMWHENAFRITGHVLGESNAHRLISPQIDGLVQFCTKT